MNGINRPDLEIFIFMIITYFFIIIAILSLNRDKE